MTAPLDRARLRELAQKLPVTDWVPPVLLTLFVALIALWIGVAFTAYRSLQRD